VEEVQEVKLRKRKSGPTKQKKNSAASKYSKQLLSQVSLSRQKTQTAQGAQPKTATSAVLLSSLFKDVFASVDEIIQMNADVVELCQSSGCSLIEAFYGLNEALPADKKHFSNEQVIEFLCEQLEQLARGVTSELDFEH